MSHCASFLNHYEALKLPLAIQLTQVTTDCDAGALRIQAYTYVLQNAYAAGACNHVVLLIIAGSCFSLAEIQS